jgi:retinol dehydrogenase-12
MFHIAWLTRTANSYALNVEHLILACRDVQKGEAARQQIIKSCPRRSKGGAMVEVWQLDMASFGSILAFGEKLKNISRLDAFLANAGIDVVEYKLVAGWESILLVNVIATFLVGLLALPALKRTQDKYEKDTHLVFTGSVIHIFAKYDYLSKPAMGQIFKILNNETTADMADRYHLSKLMDILLSRELARRLGGTVAGSKTRYQTIVNCVNPGWCRTDLFRENDGGLGGRIGLALIGRSSEEGSRTLVHAASANRSSHGCYLSECRIKPEGEWVRSEAGIKTGARLWDELAEILEGIVPGITRL